MVFFIGMPGAGKTYWGKKVADAYGYSFTDLDAYIEKKEKTSIATLFEIEGQDGFRDMENRYLETLIRTTEPDSIIACGGGTPCFYNNMDMMLKAGDVVYLQTTVERLMSNLKNDKVQRPLLKKSTSLETTLANMLEQRKEDYERAQHILQTENISLTTFEKILTNV